MKNELKTPIVILALGLGQIPAHAVLEKEEQLLLLRVPRLFLLGSQDDNKKEILNMEKIMPRQTAMNAGSAEERRLGDRYQHCGG